MNLSAKEQNRLKSCYGSWALVTGASSGIGLELAERLAEAGLNIVLHGRKLNTLEQTAKHLQSAYKVSTMVIAANLEEKEEVNRLISITRTLDIGLLVASAGYGTSGLFTDSNIEGEAEMVAVNCTAVLRLTHHYSKEFIRRKKGGIILLSSLVAFQGVPYAANYAATKAYIQSLAEALYVELKPYNVDVLAAAPGPVKSGFGGRANMEMDMALTPAQVGTAILNALGRQSTVLPGWLTKVLTYSLRTVPRFAKVLIMQQVMGGMTAHQRQ